MKMRIGRSKTLNWMMTAELLTCDDINNLRIRFSERRGKKNGSVIWLIPSPRNG